MTPVVTLDLAALVAEFEELKGWKDFVGVFVPETPGIYCCDCSMEESTWFFDGDTFCEKCFAPRLRTLVEDTRAEVAARRKLEAEAAELVKRAQAEGLEITLLDPERLACDTGRNCRCHRESYMYNIEGQRYCLNGTIALLREVLV